MAKDLTFKAKASTKDYTSVIKDNQGPKTSLRVMTTIGALKVTQGHRFGIDRKPACDFLPIPL